MEAKDIVAEEVARQAEFGMEPSWEDFVIAGQKAGIREVVEWMITQQLPKEYQAEEYRGLVVIAQKQWQAKLKEWRVADA